MINLEEAYRKDEQKTNKRRTKNEQRTNKERTKDEQNILSPALSQGEGV